MAVGSVRRETRAALNEALAVAQPQGREPYKDLQVQVHLTNAQLAISERKLQQASTEAQKALALAGPEDKLVAVEAGYVLGLAQSLAGQAASGHKRCEEAMGFWHRGLPDPKLLSSALLAQAESALLAGDLQAVLANAAEAQGRFGAAKQRESEWRAWLLQARASERLGNKSRAEPNGRTSLKNSRCDCAGLGRRKQ